MRILLVALASVLVLTGCVKSGGPVNPPPSGSPSVSVSADPEILILSTRIWTNGTVYITDSFGRAVYVYGGDGGSETSKCPEHLCNNDRYIPLIAPDNVRVSGGLDEGLVGVGGEGQVLYNGHLLYLYTRDAFPSLLPTGVNESFYLINSRGNSVGIA